MCACAGRVLQMSTLLALMQDVINPSHLKSILLLDPSPPSPQTRGPGRCVLQSDPREGHCCPLTCRQAALGVERARGELGASGRHQPADPAGPCAHPGRTGPAPSVPTDADPTHPPEGDATGSAGTNYRDREPAPLSMSPGLVLEPLPGNCHHDVPGCWSRLPGCSFL